MSLRLITNSEMKVRRRCAREHHITYELGYRSARDDADALRFGTLIHKCLEQWWAHAPEHRLAQALAVLEHPEIDPFDVARARPLIIGYDARWCDEPLEPVWIRVPEGRARPAVEVEFRAPLINPLTRFASKTFELGGKLDALVRDRDTGHVFVMEHKTSADDLSPGSVYWQMLQLDAQVSLYYVGAKSLGFDIAGTVYDVLGKPKLRPFEATPLDKRKYTAKTGELYANQHEADETPAEFEARITDEVIERPDRYLVRATVVRLEAEERDAQWDAWQDARSIRDAELMKRWPRNPEACRRWGSMCSLFPVCTGQAALDDPSLYRKTERVHEELAAELTTEGSR